MKKIMTILVALAGVLAPSFAQESDPVLMRVNGKDVTRGEFEYEFNKNNSDGAVDGTTVEAYLPMFIDYKLKVEAAYTARYDTLKSYQDEFRMYRDQLIRPMLVTDGDVEKEVRNYYDNMDRQIGEKGLCHAGHIFVMVKQQASTEEADAAKARIDSIYAELQGGADFAELARKHSQDGSAQRGGDLGVFGPGQMVKDFEDAAYALADSTYGAPIRTQFGWHIIKTYEHRKLEPYEELHDQIKAFLERRNVREHLATTIADSLSKERGVTLASLLDAECERICAEDAETRFLVKEYREGLLLFEICDREIWKPAQADEKGQQAYFKKHRNDYTWDEPRYMGAVLMATDDAALAEAKKMLGKTKDHSKWVDLVKTQMNADSVRVRIEYRLFKKGDNKWVDKEVFGEDRKPVASAKYKSVGLVGTLLKKKAAQWIDVRQQLQQDYQRHCEKQWVETLRKLYSVEVDEEVLKTVNKH